MKIKKVQLKNGYKRFHDLTIDLGDDPKRIVALVGPNGCGKSSVLYQVPLIRTGAPTPAGRGT
ncbi:AAA family ATPase [Microvirga aerophila]|uniref:AAA family ATPase n=1 Tax=Microvirga aerophila TaxID=670291 RepID=UPI001FDFA2DF|nr:AAA family ATPase [Microvirga aerophila]